MLFKNYKLFFPKPQLLFFDNNWKTGGIVRLVFCFSFLLIFSLVECLAQDSPSDLHIFSLNKKNELHWTASPTAGVTYNIYRSAEPDSSNFSLLANVSTTNYLDEDLDNGIFYFYRVASVLGGVESTPTNVDASTPQASLGSYIELDGNDYLRVASNVGEIRATSRNFSLELWFNSEDVTGSNRQYLLTRKASGNGSAAQIYIQDGEITAHNYINIPGTFPELPFATGLQSNTWYHLTITQTVAGSLRTMKAYLNGVLQRTWDLPEGFTLNFAGTDSQYWYIGAREGNTNSLRGKVAEFRLWNKTLSDTEINSNYQVRLKGDEVDLNGLFHFDDIYNITAYNYTSVLRNAITFGDPFAHDPHVKATDDSETILEDVASEFNVKANDIFSNPSQSPKVRTEIITSPSNGTVEVLSNYNILYTPDADFVGTDIIKYLIVDSTALGDIYQFSDTAFVNITINPVNDAPSFTAGANQTINEDAGQQTIINWATNISLGPANENAQTPGFILTNNNNALFSVQPAIDATGELTYTSANNANGSATVDVVLKDDGGTSNNGVDSTAHVTFTITVNPVNDAPVITSGNTFSVQENTLAVTTITATDVDAGDTQSFSITGGVDASLFNIDPSTGVLTFSISPDYENPSDDDGNNDYEVTVTVTDGSGATGTKDITVNVTDENESNYFITTWQTTTNNEQITIPTVGSGYNYKIIWGDGSQDSNVTGNIDHTYTTAGIYTVMIIGDFPRIYFNNVGDKDKILTVEQWGNITWSSMQSAFQGCGNLSIPAIDAPDLSNVESMKSMFYDAKSFNSAIGHWDVSHITDMSYMFWSASAFNQDISDWNVSLVTDMSYMFHMASSFNQPIGKWDVSSVITMHNIFYRAQSLDQNLGAWVLNENLNINYNAWAGSGMSCNSYSATLQGWATNTSPNTLINKTLRIPLKYGSQAIEARAKLTTPVAEGGFGWIITDDRLNTGTNDCSTTKPFVTTWKTDNPGTSNDDQVIIPTDGGGYDYYLHWVDVTDAAVNATVGPFTGNATLTFPAVGNYRVTIVGDFPQISFYQSGEQQKILEVNQWGDNPWRTMNNAFRSCTNLTVPATDAPNFSNTTNIGAMFFGCTSFNDNINHWNVSNIENMSTTFRGAEIFDQPLDNWDVRNVKSMTGLFTDAKAFNQSLNDWKVDGVTNMANMFQRATAFNLPLDQWNVGAVTNMENMFRNSNFNQDISGWDVSAVTNMASMFRDAAFNQDISGWNVSNVTDMTNMFYKSRLDYNLGNWMLNPTVDMSGMFSNSALSCTNYSETLSGWASNNPLVTERNLGATNVTYGSLAIEARAKLTTPVAEGGMGWTILNDELGTGSADCTPTGSKPFVTIWKTDNSGTSNDDQIIIPTYGGGYDYYLHWVDVTDAAVNATVGPFTGNATLTFPAVGNYRVTIVGDFPQIYFDNSGDKDKLLRVEQWGDNPWTSMERAFHGCSNLRITATDAPDLSLVTTMSFMLAGATSLDDDINHWDVANVEDMSSLFKDDEKFNQPLNDWTVDKATTMKSMFDGAKAFNQALDQWTLTSVTDMSYMFNNAYVFDQNISNWDVSNVTTMQSMFKNARKFNQLIGTWTVDKVTNMESMFSGANYNDMVFNQDLSNWNVSNVTDMSSMFYRVSVFNQNLGSWKLDAVVNMSDMLTQTGLNCINYSATLIGWQNNNPTLTGVALGATGLNYGTNAISAREKLINDQNWTINDGGSSGSECLLFTLDAIADANVDENTDYTSVTPAIVDGTPIGTLTYTLGGSDAADFTIDAAIGVVKMIARDFEAPVDDNTDNVYELTIRATDENGNYDEESWTVEINNLNDNEPIADDESVSTAEEVNYTFASNDFSNDYSDADGNGFAGIRLTSLPGQGILKYDGITLLATDVAAPGYSIADITKLVFIPETDKSGSPYTTFDFEVYDGGSYSTSSYTMTINVTPYVPSVSLAVDNSTIAENAGVATFTASLDKSSSKDVTVTLSYSGTAIGSGTDYTTATGTNATSVTEIVIPSGSTTGSVEVTAVDDFLDENDETITVTISSPINATLSANIEVTTTITDNDATGVTVSAISGNTTEDIGSATFTVKLNSQPTADVVIALSSNDTSEGTVQASITITPSNWNTAQTVTVTGVDDDIIDGNITYKVVTGDITSADGNYSALTASDISDISVINTDNDAAGFTLSKTTATTSESGTTDNFNVVLDAQPASDVVISVTSADTGEGTVSPASLTFTPSNWNTSQMVTITGMDDNIIDGTQTYNVTLSIVDASSDNDFDVLSDQTVSVNNTDDDAPGFTISKTTATTSESGATDDFTVVLNAQPSSDVVISVTSADTGEGTVLPATLTFTSANWITAQTVTITGINDNLIDGIQNYNVTLSIVDASSDNDFDALSDQTVSVNNTDDDAAGFTLSKATATTSESGTTDNFTVVLGAQPASDVVISVTSADIGEGTVSPATLTFTPSNWNTTQMVTITGVDDDLIDGTQNYNVTLSIVDASSDNDFDALSDQTVSVNNTDDDAAGFTLSKTTAATSESGTTDNFTMVLNTQPSSAVVFSITSEDTSEGKINPSESTISLTPANWNIPQSVTITGVDDFIIDGDQTYDVTVAIKNSADANYSSLSGKTVTIINTDDDSPGFEVSETTASTSESGTTDNFMINLMSQPDTDVVISITPGDTSEGTVSPATLTFTPANWNVAQSVTITGLADDIIDGVINYDITIAIVDALSDDNFDGWPSKRVAVSNVDTDTAPTASNNSNSTNEDITLTIPQASGLLSNASDADGDVLSILSFEVETVNYNPGQTANLSEGSLTINADGSYMFVPSADYNGTVPLITYIVTDGVNSDNATLTLNIIAVNDAPIFTSTPLSIATPGVLYTYNITATDTDGDALNFSMALVPDWLTLTDNGDGTATLSGTPTNDDLGNDALIVQVNDGTANVSQSFSITVSKLNEAPVFTSTPITEATEDELYNYSITASDADGDVLTISASSKPDWLSLLDNGDGSATLSGTPLNEHVGLHTISLTVSDNTLSDLQSFELEVLNTNDAPDSIIISNDRVMELMPIGTYVGELTTLDADKNDSHVYALLNADEMPFYLIGDSLHTTEELLYPERNVYELQIESTDLGGLKVVDTINIYVDQNNNIEVIIPSAFTPNNDGENDNWELPNINRYETYSIIIIDRNGNEVFSSSDYTRAWDGKFKGRQLPIGQYYYFIKTFRSGESKTFKGTVTIL